MDSYLRFRKCLVVGIILLFVNASTTLCVNAFCTNPQLPRVIQQHIQALPHDVIEQQGFVENVKVSLGTGNDSNPRMTTNAKGDIIIVYEQKEDIFTTTVPVVYSADGGDTWTQQFLFNSLDYQGSGILSSPDIIYNPSQDILWFNAVDPNVEMYNEMHFIPGDIANSTETIGYVTGAGTNAKYSEAACTHTNDYFLSFTTEDYGGDLERIFGSEWYCYPDYTLPPGLGGLYFDGQSLIRIAPVAESEADYNANRWFLVAESEAIAGGTQICIKSGTTDKALIDSGAQQNHMDKYGDIEQAPGEFLGLGTDPDVSGSGNNVAVVFVREGTILCAVSSCVATYEPEFHWQTTIVEAGGASTPAVYIQGNNVYVAYVKNGNLYYKVSEDRGASFGETQQKNDVEGTVVAQKGSVDVCKFGIAFVDNRNGNNDVYFVKAKAAAVADIVIDTISGGFGVSAVIMNDGDAPATNVEWSITTQGTVFIGKEKSGTITILKPGEEVLVNTGLMLGFGAITVTVRVDIVKKSEDFDLFLIFVKEQPNPLRKEIVYDLYFGYIQATTKINYVEQNDGYSFFYINDCLNIRFIGRGTVKDDDGSVSRTRLIIRNVQEPGAMAGYILKEINETEEYVTLEGFVQNFRWSSHLNILSFPSSMIR